MTEMDALLSTMVELGASDLHVKPGALPVFRVSGRLTRLEELGSPSGEQAIELGCSMMSADQQAAFRAGQEVDFAYSMSEDARFRVNAFWHRGTAGLAIRRVGMNSISIEDLGLPKVLYRLAEQPRGLVLVTGTAGSGKSTATGAMIEYVNRTRAAHIVTIEDPIEAVFHDAKGIINQREVGIDTDSYATALRHVVRQDPDVIFIGEMRDHETVSAALSAAETGSLVFSTLHTIDATETVNRIIDFFELHEQRQVRLMLASALRGVVSLRLIPSVAGGLVPAVEVLVVTGTVREYITDPDKTHLIPDAMQDGQYYGMQTFDQSLLDLFTRGLITYEDAEAMSANAHDFRIKVRALGMQPPSDSAFF